MDEKTYLRVKDVATLLSVDRMTVYGWLWDGKLPYIKVGGIIRIGKTDLDEFIKSHPKGE